jgi:O-antigen/teichoic acid export membrane protein
MTILHKFMRELAGDIKDIAFLRKDPFTLIKVSLYRNAIYLLLAAIANAGFGFIFWVIAARLYPPAVVGQASAIVSAIYLLAYTGGMGMGSGLIRYLPEAGVDSRKLINATITFCALSCLVLAIIFMSVLSFLAAPFAFLRDQWLYMAIFIGYSIGTLLFGLLNSIFIARRKAAYLLIQTVIYCILKVTILGIIWGSLAYTGIISAYNLGYVICFVIGISVFIPKIEGQYNYSPRISWLHIRKLQHYSFSNFLAQLFWIAPTYILPLIVLDRLGGEQNAYFYIAWTVAGFASQIGIAISTSLFSEGSNDKNTLYQNIKRSIKFGIVLLLPVILLLLVFGEKLLLIFGSNYALNSAPVAWILTIAAVPITLNWIYFGVKMVNKEMKPVVLANAFTAIITIVASYFLLPSLGILATGLVWLICHSIITVIIIFIGKPLKSILN